MTTPIFDWANAEKRLRPAHFLFLKTVHGTPITEGEFIARIKALGLSKMPPNRLKNEYRTLKNKFHFFAE